MKKRVVIFLLFCWAVFTAIYAEPYFVRVNGTTDYPTVAVGETDAQGRSQYKTSPVPLKSGDVITVYDEGADAAWAITQLDPYGAHANFSASTNGITCNVDSCYTIYIKLKYADDQIYIEGATGCDDEGEEPEPEPEPEPELSPNLNPNSLPIISRVTMLLRFPVKAQT